MLSKYELSLWVVCPYLHIKYTKINNNLQIPSFLKMFSKETINYKENSDLLSWHSSNSFT